MGAIPNKLPGFQDLERDVDARARFEAAWGAPIEPHYGWHLTQMFHGMERGELRDAVRHRREPGPVGGGHPPGAQAPFRARLPDRAGHPDDEDRRDGGRRLPELRLVVRGGGDRHELRAARAALPQGARSARRRRATTSGSSPSSRSASDSTGASRPPRTPGTSCARSAPCTRDELRAARGAGRLQWPCPTEDHPGSRFLHGRLWEEPREGPAAPFSPVEHRPPFEALDADYPIRLTTGRRLESYNTGVQSNLYRSPLHRGEAICLSPEDAERLLLEEGEIARVSSRRGAVEAPVRIDRSLRPGLAFMTLHFPGRGRHERADDRRDRSEVGHGRVQGGRDPRREDRRRRPARNEGRSRNRRLRADAHRLRGRIGRWTSTCSTPSHRRRAGAPSTACSAPPPRAGRAECGQVDDEGQLHTAAHGARAAAPPPAPGAPRGSRARRLDQPRRAQLRLPASHRAACRRVRRRDVLRAVLARVATAAGRPRLRRPRLPL